MLSCKWCGLSKWISWGSEQPVVLKSPLNVFAPFLRPVDIWHWRMNMKGFSLSRKYPHLSFPLSEALEEELLGHQPPPLLHGALLRGEPNHITNILLTFNKLQLACHDRLFLPDRRRPPTKFSRILWQTASHFLLCGMWDKTSLFSLSPRNARMHAIHSKKG